MVCMRVLLTTKRGAGHFGPLIPFAHAFRRAGADVRVAAPDSAAAMVRAEGFPVETFADAPDEERDAVFADAFQRPDDEQAPYVFADAFARIDARAALPGMLEICERFGPDVVMSEVCEFAGPLVAEALGLRAISVGITQQAEAEAVLGASQVLPALDELRDELGLVHDPQGERLLALPYFTLMPAALENPLLPLARGAWRFREREAPLLGTGADWARGDDPLVYLTFGSVAPETAFFPGIYRLAIDALAALPIRVLVTIGRARDAGELGPLPSNVHVEQWVPQREVMPHAAVMVCHGGSGTVTMGLAGGVPMAVVPLFADQPDNAKRVAAVGAGLALTGGPEAVADVGDAVSKLIVDPAYRANARAVADEMRALPAVDAAPAVVRELVADRAGVAIV
jgi:UDP:flavonoid glycosyltransferase YjiC (YdhE family)